MQDYAHRASAAQHAKDAHTAASPKLQHRWQGWVRFRESRTHRRSASTKRSCSSGVHGSRGRLITYCLRNRGGLEAASARRCCCCFDASPCPVATMARQGGGVETARPAAGATSALSKLRRAPLRRAPERNISGGGADEAAPAALIPNLCEAREADLHPGGGLRRISAALLYTPRESRALGLAGSRKVQGSKASDDATLRNTDMRTRNITPRRALIPLLFLACRKGAVQGDRHTTSTWCTCASASVA